MEVLVFGYSFTVGGVENYLNNINSILPKEVRFHFVIEKHNGGRRIESANDLSFTLVPDARLHLKEYISSINKLLRERRKTDNTVYINASDFKIENYVVIKLANKYKYKVVTHAHAAMGNDVVGIIHRISHKYICCRSRFLTNSKSNIRLAVSNRAGNYLYGNFPYELLSPGINAKRYKFNPKMRKEVRNKFNITTEFVIGFVGRLVDIKNPLFAIKILQKLMEKNGYVNSKMLIIGDGPLRDSLEKQISDNQLDASVILAGQVKNVEDYLNAMDCMVGTSISEGLPLTILEALASGLYCICAEHNYPEELKQFDCYSTVKIGDDYLDEWVDLIISIKNQDNNREEGYKAVVSQGYDQRAICNRLIDFLN